MRPPFLRPRLLHPFGPRCISCCEEGRRLDRYLLVARSITHAQQMMKVLERGGVRTRVLRASAELTGRGCGYTLEVSERHYAAAMRRLQETQLRPLKVVRQSGEERREVSP